MLEFCNGGGGESVTVASQGPGSLLDIIMEGRQLYFGCVLLCRKLQVLLYVLRFWIVGHLRSSSMACFAGCILMLSSVVLAV